MNKYAVIQHGVVVNTVLWDNESEWVAPEGTTIKLMPEYVGIGWSLVDGEWTAPEELEPVVENAAKQSALAKLATLGLTANEIEALLK